MSIKLKDLYIFEWIDSTLVTLIIDNSRSVKALAWEYILSQGEESDNSAYIIQEWEVSVEIDWNQVWKIWEWNIFWEIALITNESRTASIIALKDLKLLKINKELLLTIIKQFQNWDEIKKTMFNRIRQNLK